MLSPAEQTLIGATILSFWGVIDCLFGYRWFRFMLAVLGAVFGGIGGCVGALQLFPGNGLVLIPGLVLGAVLGAVLFYVFFVVGLFLMGAFVGFLLTMVFTQSAGSSALLIAGAVGIVCGTLVVLFRRWLITISTAWGGAFRFSLAMVFFLNPDESLRQLENPATLDALLARHPWVPILTVVVGLLGFLFQLADQRAQSAAGKPKGKSKS